MMAPRSSSSTLTRIRKTILLSVKPRNASAIGWGTRSRARIQPSRLEAPRMTMMAAVVVAVSAKTFGRSRTFSER